MIKSDEMSSTSMDITETFRPEDLSKTDFFDFVTAPDLGIGVDRPGTDVNGTSDQPLQGYDQFWGAEKDTSRLESAIFEDLNRYCWSQQNNANGISNQPNNTDGQIYTLTVLNGTEPWLRIDNTPDQPTPALDFDSMLGNNFPGYVKTEYTYDDSGFGTDNKDELIAQSQHQQSITVTNNTINSTNMSFQNNNNNDWQMADHNVNIEDETPESLLRSALQGKGYSKGMQLQNGITIIPAKNDDELRRALFVTDQDSLSYADSTLNAPLYDENLAESPNSLPVHTTGVVVDDMFLTLDASAFTDDFDKIKRIASDVQQFCISTDSYQEIVTDVALQSASEVTTTNPTPSTKTTKKYKKSTANNNNNNNSSSNNNNLNSNNNNNSPTHCNGQRKERSLHYCSICSKGFKDKYSVNVHIRTHTGEKPFACSLCGKSFRQKAHLAKHYQTHLAQKNAGAVTKGNKQQQQQQQQTTQPLPSIQQVQLSPLPQITSISSNGQIVSNR